MDYPQAIPGLHPDMIVAARNWPMQLFKNSRERNPPSHRTEDIGKFLRP
jgi:hypothetical protein